jgi:hypothetical protein
VQVVDAHSTPSGVPSGLGGSASQPALGVTLAIAGPAVAQDLQDRSLPPPPPGSALPTPAAAALTGLTDRTRRPWLRSTPDAVATLSEAITPICTSPEAVLTW